MPARATRPREQAPLSAVTRVCVCVCVCVCVSVCVYVCVCREGGIICLWLSLCMLLWGWL